jgi:hypothetical protein
MWVLFINGKAGPVNCHIPGGGNPGSADWQRHFRKTLTTPVDNNKLFFIEIFFFHVKRILQDENTGNHPGSGIYSLPDPKAIPHRTGIHGPLGGGRKHHPGHSAAQGPGIRLPRAGAWAVQHGEFPSGPAG